MQTGLRASELTGLYFALHLARGAHVNCLGKGCKQRITPLTKPVAAALRTWLKERAGTPGAPVFPTTKADPVTPPFGGADGASATALQPPPHLLTTLPVPAGGGRCVHPGAPPTDRAPSLRPAAGSFSELASSVSPSVHCPCRVIGPASGSRPRRLRRPASGSSTPFRQGCRRVRGDQHDRDARARKAVNGEGQAHG